MVFISTKHNIQPILKAKKFGKMSCKSQGSCSDFFWQVSNVVSEVRLEFRSFIEPYILCFFPWGGVGGGGLFNIFSLKGGANSKGGTYLKEGANSSIYSNKFLKQNFKNANIIPWQRCPTV